MASIDTSMYQQNPLRSVADYEGDYIKQAMAKQAMQQNALTLQTGQMGLQEKQREITSANALRDVGMSFGKDPQANAMMILQKTGDIKAAQAYMKSAADQAKVAEETRGEAVKTQGMTDKQKRDAVTFNLQSLSTVNNPQQYALWLDGGVKSGLMTQQEADAQKSQIPQTPGEFAQLKQQQMMAGVELAKQFDIKAAAGRDAESAANNLRVDSRTKRGQDMTAATAAAGQSIQVRGQNMTDDRSRDLNSTVKATAAETKKVEQVDKAVTKFSTELQKEGIPDIEAGLAAAEGVFKRYTDPKTGKLKDMPGIGAVTNALPDWAVSSEGKDVRESMSALANIVLSARSGAAVTDQEMRRLARELSNSVGSSAEDMQRAYGKFRARFEMVKANAAAGVSDDVKRTYEDRGGVKIERGGASTKDGAGHPSDISDLLKKYVK